MKSFLAHTSGGNCIGAKAKRPRFEFLGVAEHTSSSSSDGDMLGHDGVYSSQIDYSKPSLRLHALLNRLDSSINTMACEGEVISDMFVSIGSHFRRYNQLVSNTLAVFKDVSLVCAERGIDANTHTRNSETQHNYMVEPTCHEPQCSVPSMTNRSSSLSLGSHQAPPPPPVPMLPRPMAPLLNHAASLSAPSSPSIFHNTPPTTAHVAKPAITLSAKRPLSDFNFFCRDARKLVVEAHPEYTKEQVNKELGRIWSVLDKNSRQHYRAMYIQDKMRYKQDVATLSGSAKRDASGNKRVNNATNLSAIDGGMYDRICDQVKQTIRRCASLHSDNPTVACVLDPSALKHHASANISPSDAKSLPAKMYSHSQRFSASQNIHALPPVLSNRLSPRTPEETDEADDIDEPLAHTLLRANSQQNRLTLGNSGQEESALIPNGGACRGSPADTAGTQTEADCEYPERGEIVKTGGGLAAKHQGISGRLHRTAIAALSTPMPSASSNDGLSDGGVGSGII